MVAAPAVAVAVSNRDILGGGGAGRRGVFWDLAASGWRAGETVRMALISELCGRKGTLSILSRSTNDGALLRLKVGGASFS